MKAVLREEGFVKQVGFEPGLKNEEVVEQC